MTLIRGNHESRQITQASLQPSAHIVAKNGDSCLDLNKSQIDFFDCRLALQLTIPTLFPIQVRVIMRRCMDSMMSASENTALSMCGDIAQMFSTI